MYKIIIKDRDNKEYAIIENLDYASTFKKRLIGLMFKKEFNGLIFKQKKRHKILSSIHTSFMKTTIDILYINSNMEIQEITTLKPWKIYIPLKSNIKYIIELPENTIKRLNIKQMQKVVIKNEKTKNKQTQKHNPICNEHYKK
ncbi:MAG: DUF192 domain-containing protein [Methanosphaera sp.]|nr:DUF192 domain-containing protein [Methanosphaera sp.]